MSTTIATPEKTTKLLAMIDDIREQERARLQREIDALQAEVTRLQREIACIRTCFTPGTSDIKQPATPNLK